MVVLLPVVRVEQIKGFLGSFHVSPYGQTLGKITEEALVLIDAFLKNVDADFVGHYGSWPEENGEFFMD
jgi:hypothetical protein